MDRKADFDGLFFLGYLTFAQALTTDEKNYYEREADKHNGMNPVDPTKDEEEEDEELKRQQVHNLYDQAYPAHDLAGAAGYSHMHGGIHPSTAHHDPRHHGYYYPPTHAYYDYSGQHHQQQGRSRGLQHQYQYPPQQGHGYDYK
jgi:hypothetical protein